MRFLELIVVNEDNDRNGMFQFHLGELHVARETRITFFFCRELKLKLKLKSKAYVIILHVIQAIHILCTFKLYYLFEKRL